MVNRNDVIRMAREAGGVFIDPPSGDCYTFDIDNGELERFFQAAYNAGAADEREAWQPLLKAAQGVIDWTEIAHRSPVKVDELEVGRMVCVRLHALTDLDAAIRARKENT